MFYSKSRISLKKNIKLVNIKLTNFRFNINLIRFNQLVTNVLLRNITKTILSNSFFIKKNILISNTKKSLSNKINNDSNYDFKLFCYNKKIINKKKKYSILSKRKDLQIAKLKVSGKSLYNTLHKNKYKEILKKLEKFGSIWKPKLKKNQNFVYHLPSKVGYIVADRLNNKSIIKYGFANIRGRKNTKPYYLNNKLSIGDLNRKLESVYKEKYQKINYLNISKSSIFNSYYLYKHFRKYINLVPTFSKIKKQLRLISKKIINNKNLNKSKNFLIKFDKKKIKLFKINFNIKRKYKVNSKKIIKNNINNNILFSNIKYYINKNKTKKLKKLFFLRLNKKYKRHISWKYSKITWISKFRQQSNPRLKLVKKKIFKKIRYVNYSKIRNSIYDNIKKYKKFSKINFSNLSLLNYISLRNKKIKKQNKNKFKNRFRWKYFQLRRKIKNNKKTSIKKQKKAFSNINNINYSKFLNFFKKSNWSLVNSQNIKNIIYINEKSTKFKDFNILSFNFINFKYKFKIILGSIKKGFKKIKFKKRYILKSSKLKSNTLDASTTLLKLKLFYLKFVKYNNKININFIINKNLKYTNMSNLLSTVNTNFNKSLLLKNNNTSNFYLNNSKKNLYNNLIFLKSDNNKLKTFKSKIFLNSSGSLNTQDWYKIRSLELTNYWPKINLITNLDIKNKIKIKCNKESVKLKNYLFNLNFRNISVLDKKRFKLKFFSLNFPNFKNYYSKKPGLFIDSIMRQSKEFSFFITKKENSKISVIGKYRYNQYKHLNVNLKKYEYKQLMSQKLRRRLRKRLVNLLKKKLIWFNLKKKSFRKSGWGWKSKYLNRKIKYHILRKNIKKKFDHFYNDSNSPTIRNEPIEFIGFKLINKLQNKLIYRKFRYNNIRKSFYPTKNYIHTMMYWSKFKDKISKILKPLYKTMKYTNRKRSGFWRMKMYYWKFKSIYLKHPYKQFAQRYYPKIWYKIFRRKFPLKRHRKDWAFRINKAKHMKYFKHEKTLTFYDSSSVYFKYLSSSVKLKKYKNEKRILRKFASQKEDELVGILTKEIEPDFKFRHKLNIKSANWRHYDPLKTGVLNAKIFGTMTMPSMVTKGVGGQKFSDIQNSDYKFHYSLLGKNIRNVVLNKVRLMSFFFELVSKKFKNKNWVNSGFGWNTDYQLETKEFSDNIISLDSKNIINKSENTNKYNIFYKNIVFRHELNRSFLIFNFIRSYYSKTEEIADIYNGESVVSNRYLRYTKRKSSRIDRWVVNYVYKTKYRKVSLFNKLRLTKIKYFNDIDKLILKNSKNFLNKNSSIVSKFFAKYKDIDFLTDRVKSYQFTNRISKFYQKNLWIFNTFEVQTGNGSWSKLFTKNKNNTIFKII